LDNKDAHLKVRFPFSPWGTYNILATDYTTYTVIYECDNYLFDTLKMENIWVLTREPLNHASENDAPKIKVVTDVVKKAFADNNIDYDIENAHKSAQVDDCSYAAYPDELVGKNSDECKAAYADMGACDADADCTWCKASAVPSMCLATADAGGLPYPSFDCTGLHEFQ
jgi:hypothetical protein